MLTSGEYLNFLASQDAPEVMGPDSVSDSALALTDLTLVIPTLVCKITIRDLIDVTLVSEE